MGKSSGILPRREDTSAPARSVIFFSSGCEGQCGDLLIAFLYDKGGPDSPDPVIGLFGRRVLRSWLAYRVGVTSLGLKRRKRTAREGLDETESDCYGMFATTNLRRGETILREGKVICGAGLIPRDSLPAAEKWDARG